MKQQFLILADGSLGVFEAKTATSLLRYRGDDVVAVLDRQHAGRSTRRVLGVAADAPIVGSLAEGLAHGPDTLVIGIAPPGGALPAAWREIIAGSLRAGLSVYSGLHTFLADDPEFARLAREHGGAIRDFRRPPDEQPIATRRARETRGRRVLTVGTDCNVGKMAAALEIYASARRRSVDARFVATGQTGMMISGRGVTLDRIPGDFMAGHVEQQVLADGDSELIVVEGQGSLLHPAYSGVTLALMHGSLPDAMVLVHHAGRDTLRYTDVPVPPLTEWIRRYEDALAPLHRGKVVAIAINPYGLSEAEAERAIHAAEDETGLPAVDAVRQAGDRLVEAVWPAGG